MKKLIVVVVMLCLCLLGCTDSYSVWAWGDEELGVRVGNIIDANRVEVGLSTSWQDADEEPRTLGLYAIRHLPEIIQVPNPIAWEGLPETLSGRPYFGVAIDRDLIDNSTNFPPIAGVIIEDFLYIGHQLNSDRPDSTTIGVRWKF